MDRQTLSNLIEQSKNGSRKAMEQLLIFAHTPVSFQCTRLLNDPKLAEEMTEKILKSLSSQISKIENADYFHKWLGNITATRCMKKREQITVEEYIPETQDLNFPSKELSKAETAQVALILADSLPEDLRICLILSACCRASTKAIAQMTGFAEDTVTKYAAEAELGIREQMQVYQNQGVVFAGSLTVGTLLRTAMYGKQNRSAAAAMVRKTLPPVAPAPTPVKPPKKPNNTIKILLCVAVALVLLVVLLICGALMGKKEQEAEETTQPSTIATTAVTETTEATTKATTEATTETTTEPTTEATTVPETTEAVETTVATEETEPVKNTPVQSGNATGQGTGQSTTGTNTTGTSQGNQSGSGNHKHDLVYMSPYPNFERNPTCESDGWSLFWCTSCRDVIPQPDPVRRPSLGGHDYHATDVFPPSKYHEGFTTYTCSKCNDAYRADYVPALTPDPETQPPLVETQPPVVETQAPVVETQAPVVEQSNSGPEAPASDDGE